MRERKKVYELKDYLPLDGRGMLVLPDEENSWEQRRRAVIASLEHELAVTSLPSKVAALKRAIAIWEAELQQGEPADIDVPRSVELQCGYGRPGRRQKWA